MIENEQIIELFLDDNCKNKLRFFYFDDNITETENLIKIKKLIRDYVAYVRSCKEKHILVKPEEGKKLLKRFKDVISMIYDEDEEYLVTMYFYSWYYNTILAIFNKINIQDYSYINEEVISFTKNFKFLINKHEDILF